eukprot:gene13172-9351_t
MDKEDYMAAGFCFFNSIDGLNYKFKIAEPIIIEAFIYYFKKNDKSIMYYIIENCMHLASPSERGTRLNHIIALSFLLEPQEIDPLS